MWALTAVSRLAMCACLAVSVFSGRFIHLPRLASRVTLAVRADGRDVIYLSILCTQSTALHAFFCQILLNHLQRRGLLQTSLQAAHILLAQPPSPRLHKGMWRVVCLAAICALDHVRRASSARALAGVQAGQLTEAGAPTGGPHGRPGCRALLGLAHRLLRAGPGPSCLAAPPLHQPPFHSLARVLDGCA